MGAPLPPSLPPPAPLSSHRVAAAHSSSPYTMYHWSVRATTHSSPERETTARSGSA